MNRVIKRFYCIHWKRLYIYFIFATDENIYVCTVLIQLQCLGQKLWFQGLSSPTFQKKGAFLNEYMYMYSFNHFRKFPLRWSWKLKVQMVSRCHLRASVLGECHYKVVKLRISPVTKLIYMLNRFEKYKSMDAFLNTEICCVFRMLMKQPWRIWVNRSPESTRNSWYSRDPL